MNDRVKNAIESFTEKKLKETGTQPTENELFNVYFGQYLTDRRNNQIDDYNPEELQELEKRYESTINKWKSDKEIQDFINQNKTDQPKAYRTKANAGEVITDYPNSVVAITFKDYENAMSVSSNGKAYLTPLDTTDGLQFKDGKMYFSGVLEPITEAELQNMKTKESITSIDLPLLRSFYSILLTKAQKELIENNTIERGKVVTLFVPDLAGHLGTPGKLNDEKINAIVEKTRKFHNVVGIFKTPYGDTIMPVLNFEGYNKEKNTISFYSPYMNYVIQKLYELSIRRNEKGSPKLTKSGNMSFLPKYSYVIKPTINKERNKYAVENVDIIVKTIEKTGQGIPHISANTIIERNELLKQALQESKNKQQLLKRCFMKTWEILRTQTRLTEVYEDIELPDPKNPANIPTAKTLNETVFEFPHKGKKTTSNEQ